MFSSKPTVLEDALDHNDSGPYLRGFTGSTALRNNGKLFLHCKIFRPPQSCNDSNAMQISPPLMVQANVTIEICGLYLYDYYCCCCYDDSHAFRQSHRQCCFTILLVGVTQRTASNSMYKCTAQIIMVQRSENKTKHFYSIMNNGHNIILLQALKRAA